MTRKLNNQLRQVRKNASNRFHQKKLEEQLRNIRRKASNKYKETKKEGKQPAKSSPNTSNTNNEKRRRNIKAGKQPAKPIPNTKTYSNAGPSSLPMNSNSNSNSNSPKYSLQNFIAGLGSPLSSNSNVNSNVNSNSASPMNINTIAPTYTALRDFERAFKAALNNKKRKNTKKKPNSPVECPICLDQITNNNATWCRHGINRNGRKTHGICKNCNHNTLKTCPTCRINEWRMNKNGNPISSPAKKNKLNEQQKEALEIFQREVNQQDQNNAELYNINLEQTPWPTNTRANWSTIHTAQRLNYPAVISDLNNFANYNLVRHYQLLTNRQQRRLWNWLTKHYDETNKYKRVYHRINSLYSQEIL